VNQVRLGVWVQKEILAPPDQPVLKGHLFIAVVAAVPLAPLALLVPPGQPAARERLVQSDQLDLLVPPVYLVRLEPKEM
jgi:hypothetical protein